MHHSPSLPSRLASAVVLFILLLSFLQISASAASPVLGSPKDDRSTESFRERSMRRVPSRRSGLSGLTSLDSLNLAAREGPADELAMVMAVESTLSLLQAQATSMSKLTSLVARPTQHTPSSTASTPSSSAAHREPTPSAAPQPSESAVINYLIPLPGEQTPSFIPGIDGMDIAAVSVVAVVVIVILVAFCLPRKKSKHPATQPPAPPSSRYIVEPPEYSRYPFDLEKGSPYEFEGEEEEEKAREQMSTFKFPPAPEPAHTTGHDIAASYSSQSF